MSYLQSAEFAEKSARARARSERSREVFARALFGIETAKSSDEGVAVSPDGFAVMIRESGEA